MVTSRGPTQRLLLAIAAAALLVTPAVAQAHGFAPQVLRIEAIAAAPVGTTHSYQVSWQRPRKTFERRVLEAPKLGGHCTTTTTRSTSIEETNLIDRWMLKCEGGIVGTTVEFTDMPDESAELFVEVIAPDGGRVAELLTASRTRVTLGASPGQSSTGILAYTWLGITHIAAGIDHLLFVACIMLLIRRRKTLVATLTAFTLGHSVTLSLSVLGIARLSPAATEACIALSIVFLAKEILDNDENSWARRWPWMVAVSFGLFHGMGFAGALQEAGLGANVTSALVGFNLGVEIGQIAFVVVLLGLAALWRRLVDDRFVYGHRLAATAAGALAMMWFLQRASALL